GLAPAEVQVHGGDARLVIGKVLEEFAVMQAKYKLLINHSPLLGNENSSKPVPGYDPGHTLGTGDQEPHTTPSEEGKIQSSILNSNSTSNRWDSEGQIICLGPNTNQNMPSKTKIDSESSLSFSYHMTPCPQEFIGSSQELPNQQQIAKEQGFGPLLKNPCPISSFKLLGSPIPCFYSHLQNFVKWETL
ncbi:hypothetical protein DSO57_1029562, partial [Entomophthora muscae]